MARGFGSSTFWIVALVTMLALGGLVTLARNGLVDLVQFTSERDRLVAEKEAVDDSNSLLLKDIEILRKDPEAIEPYARKDLGLAKPGEMIYRLEDKNPQN